MTVGATFSQVPQRAMDAIAHAKPDGSVPLLPGFDIKAVLGNRGEVRVWRVKEVDPPATWYIKRFRNPAVYRRYMEVFRILGQDEVPKAYLYPVQCAGHDDFHQLIATYPLQGTSANAIFVRGTRLDKLFSWPCSDMGNLARRIVRGLRAFWSYRCEVHPDLYDYRPLESADRMLKKCERLRNVVPEAWERIHAAVAQHAQRLRSISDFDYSLVLGDLTLANLLIDDEYLGIFDLEDIGIGDWRYDVACLIQRVSEAETDTYYSSRRVRHFQQLLMDEVGMAIDDPILSIYRIEFYLDMLWSVMHKNDRNLPRIGLSYQKIEQMLDSHLKGM